MPLRSLCKLVVCLMSAVGSRVCVGQAANVTAHFVVAPRKLAATSSGHQAAAKDVVLWLTRVDADSPSVSAGHAPAATGYRLIQKDKMFSPHLLVVPAGSSVEFPNLDPFFHNVFSLFDGKRFDLGLYEAGTHRVVRFEREGVSYIFCNIHPEMGAIVLALKSPFFAVSDATGLATLHDVPPGQYRVHVWAEQLRLRDTEFEGRLVQVGAAGAGLGTVALTAGPSPLLNHKNKFGEEYVAVPRPPY